MAGLLHGSYGQIAFKTENGLLIFDNRDSCVKDRLYALASWQETLDDLGKVVAVNLFLMSLAT